MATSSFMVVAPHTEKECLTSLDSLAAKGEAALANWEFGCLSGDHTSYGLIDASSKDEALKEVPEIIRTRARAVPVTKFTKEQIKEIHQAH